MTIDLPEPVAAYFTADKSDGEAVSECFTEGAVVKDEGHTYHGRAAIKKWKEEVSTKYEYTCEPLSVRTEGRPMRRHVPAYWKLSWQPGRSSVLLRTRRRKGRVVDSHPLDLALSERVLRCSQSTPHTPPLTIRCQR